MLKKLTVVNYVLAEKWEVDFEDGFSVITGETGAGKSMLFGAVALIMGARSDVNLLFDKNKKAIVEAVFDVEKKDLAGLFEQQEVDFQVETIVRREISPEGKSRAFINDTPVSLTVLKQVAEYLVDIHSQHDTQLLNNPVFQLEIVDDLAGTADLATQFSVAFKQHQQQVRLLAEKKELEAQSIREMDYLTFQLNELKTIPLESIDQVQLENALELLQNAEKIESALFKGQQVLVDGEVNAVQLLTELKQTISALTKFDAGLADVFKRISDLLIEAKDIGSELESIKDKIQHNPGEQERITELLDSLYRLQKKHQVKDVDALIQLAQTFDNQLNAFVSLGADIKAIEALLVQSEKKLAGLAHDLSVARDKKLPQIEKMVLAVLVQLGMPDARFKIVRVDLVRDQWNASGKDKVSFTFAANKGGELQEIQKVASGGELSRVMMAIKATLVDFKTLPCILFDEIDTGISGEVALKMGKIVEKMSEKVQVIAITHLPQMASRGENHYFVYKDNQGKVTQSKIKKITGEERVFEIAQMLSGAQPTQAAIKNAEDLIKK